MRMSFRVGVVGWSAQRVVADLRSEVGGVVLDEAEEGRAAASLPGQAEVPQAGHGLRPPCWIG